MITIWNLICEFAPWLLLGTALSGLLHFLLPQNFIRRRLSGRFGVARAVCFGVPLPLCSCGVVPAGIGLKNDGASDGAAVGFLISTPQTGVDSILVSAAALGWPFAIFKVITAASTGLFGGWMADAMARPDLKNLQKDDSQSKPPQRTWRDGLRHGEEILHSIWIWLIVGILISFAIEAFIPTSIFERVGAMGSFLTSVVVLLVSLPLYVCATASVPIAAQLVASGLPAGAALVFLVAGPATNAATVGAIYGKFGGKTLAVYLGSIIGGSFLFAFLFDHFFVIDRFAIGANHQHRSWWHQLSAAILLIMFAYFAWQDLERILANRNAKRRLAEHAGVEQISPSKRIAVSGMTCSNCSNRLESVLRKTKGIQGAHVNLDAGEAMVFGSISEPELRSVIQQTGFQPGEILGSLSH